MRVAALNMRIWHLVIFGLAQIASAIALADPGQLDRTFQLEEELHSIQNLASSDSPHASSQALVRWLRKTSVEDIKLVLESSRSNIEAGVFEVIHEISARGDHADALDATDELDRRVPNSSWHTDILAIKAKLNLRLGRIEFARALAQAAGDALCPCHDGPIKEWLAKGTVPKAVTMSSPSRPWLFDERGGACNEGWGTDKLDEFDAIDLIEGSAGVRTAARAQIASIWPGLVAGCVQWVDKERLQRLLQLGWTKQELSDGFAAARQSANGSATKNIDLLGAKLALPDHQCDFAADATCKTKQAPLSKDTAIRIVDRWRPLIPASSSGSPDTANDAARESKEEFDARDRLSDQYQKEMDEAAGLDAVGGLARMRSILAKEKYRHLGIFVDSYSFGQGLGRWSREGYAPEALQVFNVALGVGGPELQSRPESLTSAALLQLRSGKPKEALEFLEKRYAQTPDQETAKTIGKLRAAMGGANLLQQYRPPPITRPWQYSSGWPICDFFNITGGLGRVEDVDLITAFHGEREAALWQLAQEWPSVVRHCFDGTVWHEVRTRLQRVLGTEGFAQAVANVEESLQLGPKAHFKFAGQELPLPDSEAPVGSSDQSPVVISRERLLQIIAETHLLRSCGRDSSERCN